MYTQIVLEKVYSKCVESLKEYILQVAESGGLTHKQMELIIECRINSFLGETFLNKIDKVRIAYLSDYSITNFHGSIQECQTFLHPK